MPFALYFVLATQLALSLHQVALDEITVQLVNRFIVYCSIIFPHSFKHFS